MQDPNLVVKRDSNIKFPLMINVKRYSTLDYNWQDDSDKFMISNKNTFDDDQAQNLMGLEEKYGDKYFEDQSCYSMNTHNNPQEREHNFNFGSQYNRMFSVTSSNWTPQDGGIKDFNPADYSYSYDIQQNNSVSEYMTSGHSNNTPS